MTKGSFTQFNIPSDLLDYKEIKEAVKQFGVEIIGQYVIVCTYLIKYKDAEAPTKENIKSDLYNVYDKPIDVLNALYKVKLIQVRKSGAVYSRLLKGSLLSGVKKVGTNAKQREFHPLNEWLKKECELVSTMKTQMTYKDCSDLIEKYGETMVKDTLLDMNNKPRINRKYTSVKQTCKNWIEMKLNRRTDSPQSKGSAFQQKTRF